MGHLIPAGTGLKKFRNIIVVPADGEPTPDLSQPISLEPVEKKRVRRSEATPRE
jgi:hypothetical protein